MVSASPPRDQLDADYWATKSKGMLERLIQLENHRNKLKWQQTYRDLVIYATLAVLNVSTAYVLTRVGFSPLDAVQLTLAGLISSAGGYTLRGIVGKRREKALEPRHSEDGRL